MKKIEFERPPKLKLHNYVVSVGKKKGAAWYTAYKYPLTKKDAMLEAKRAAKGSIVEIYRASHEFIQAFEA